jgi:hypothetical protein
MSWDIVAYKMLANQRIAQMLRDAEHDRLVDKVVASARTGGEPLTSPHGPFSRTAGMSLPQRVFALANAFRRR